MPLALPWREESSATCESTNSVDRKEEEPFKIDGRGQIWSVACLVDGEHIVSGGDEGKIRWWQVADGKEVGTPMDAGCTVYSISVSRDGKWIVSRTRWGWVIVWDAENHKKVTEFTAHSDDVFAVDISTDGTRIASGSFDKTARVWSLSATGSLQRLLGPWRHGHYLSTVKFSPDGRLLATATHDRYSIRIYDNQNGHLLESVSIRVRWYRNQSFAWASDGKQLFALSSDGNIHCLDVSTGTTLSQWPIHSDISPSCISLANDGTFLAASDKSSVTLWDTATHEQIGPVLQHLDNVESIAISANYDIVTATNKTITVRSLCDILPLTDRSDKIIQSLIIQRKRSNTTIGHLKQTIQQLRNQLSDSESAFNQKETNLNETIKSFCVLDKDSNRKIACLEEAVKQLRTELVDSQQRADRLLRAHEQRYQCEVLCAEGRIADAASTLLEIVNALTEDVKANKRIMDWLSEFTNRCISALETMGDQQSNAEKHDEAFSSYLTALLLTPSAPNSLLTKWASMALICGSVNDALSTAVKFSLPRFAIYRAICDILEGHDRVTEAADCFRQMQSELGTSTHGDPARWELEFRGICVDKLEKLGDAMMDAKDHDAANRYYTAALSLRPANQTGILLKRSKARAFMDLWDEALADANKVIELDPSSPLGYERKRAALLGAHRYDEAIDAYNDMLLKLEISPDPGTRELRNQYVSPSETITAIRNCVRQQLRNAPLTIINSETGRLCDTDECMAEFEDEQIYKELVASMTKLDYDRIKLNVQEYFRYATLSHTWEGAEPLFQDVCHESVHKLKKSPEFSKLLMFCRIAQEAGLRWAWSDTCCIDKTDGSVLQESLTSMFKWYQGSSLTIVHLKDVFSDSDLLALISCLWNTRAWTLQEFFASQVIRFYTEDWKPYLPHEIAYNHKASPVIMSQMAVATGVDASVLLSLRPGSDDVRLKLCLAATRVATMQEDIAYSLFGMLDVSTSVEYGEGQQCAIGRLLDEVLTQCGDPTILAWTGKASEYNSCLPAELSVYCEPASLHVPSLIEDAKISALVAELRTSSMNLLDSAVMLYDLVRALPSPHFSRRRLSLACIMFPLRGQLKSCGDSPQRIYRAKTSALGNVEIRTTEDLTGVKDLVLVHPWLQCLLRPIIPSETPTGSDDSPPLTPLDGVDVDGDPTVFTDAPSPSLSDTASPHSSQPQLSKPTRALRFFTHLRQPFGALLLAHIGDNEYRRVASDQPIVVQLLKDATPRYLAQKIRTLDVW